MPRRLFGKHAMSRQHPQQAVEQLLMRPGDMRQFRDTFGPIF
jgi:hypothetical protein